MYLQIYIVTKAAVSKHEALVVSTDLIRVVSNMHLPLVVQHKASLFRKVLLLYNINIISSSNLGRSRSSQSSFG